MDITQLERAADILDTESFQDLASLVREAAAYIHADQGIASRRFDRFFQAALTGLLSSPATDDNTLKDIVDKAREIATLAIAPAQPVGEDS